MVTVAGGIFEINSKTGEKTLIDFTTFLLRQRHRADDVGHFAQWVAERGDDWPSASNDLRLFEYHVNRFRPQDAEDRSRKQRRLRGLRLAWGEYQKLAGGMLADNIVIPD